MIKDQGYGLIIFLASIVAAVVYLAMFFSSLIGLPAYLREWAIAIPVLLFVLLVLIIAGWIGWTMLTTPPPAPLEPETAPPPVTNSSEDAEKQ